MSLPLLNNSDSKKSCALCFQAAPFLSKSGYCSYCQTSTIDYPPAKVSFFTSFAFKLKMAFTSISLVPWLLLLITIISNHYYTTPTCPPLVFILAIILLPICGFIGIIFGHLALISITLFPINPTKLTCAILIFSLLVAYIDILLTIIPFFLGNPNN